MNPLLFNLVLEVTWFSGGMVLKWYGFEVVWFINDIAWNNLLLVK